MERQKLIPPSEIYQASEFELGVRWTDGHRSIYRGDYLRAACPCAGCVDEMTGERTLDIGQIPENVHPLEIKSVGRYGVEIKWSDGHGTGIYDFRYLRALCPCPVCRPQRREPDEHS